jgi:hypothetical protein
VLGASRKFFHIGNTCALDIEEAWEIPMKAALLLNSSETDVNATDLDLATDVADTETTATSSITTP